MASPAAVLQVFVNANTKVASAQLKAFHGQMLGVGKTSAATGAGMGKFTKGAAAAGAGVAALGVAAVVAGKQLYDLGVEFDEAYDKIRVGTGATGRELEKLKGNFKSVAKTVPNEFGEVGTAIADLNTRLGLTGKPLERMAENMLHLSNVTGDDLEGNIKAVSRAFVDWEVTVPQQTRYLDGMFRISQQSGASISQLAESVQKFGSPLRQLGFDFAEAVSMFASFERAGVNTQTMVPGLKLAISNLTRPTENLAEQMGKLGIEAGKPDVALRQIFDLLGSDSSLSRIEKTGLAMDVFGKRAGADMAEAIKQGRFEVDKFLRIFRDNQGDTIRKAADETYDFSENVKILGNNLKVFLEPAANAVFVALDDVTRALRQGLKEMDGTSKRSTTLGNIFKVVSVIVYGLGKAFQILFRTAKRTIEGQIQVIRGLWGVIKNVFGLINAIIRGDFRKAWNAARGIVRNAIRAIIGVVKTVTAPVRSVFQGVTEIVRDKFKAAYDAAANFIGKIIGVINKIPGVNINFGGEGKQKGGIVGLQRGGFLTGGRPSGDSIPAMLERGEYVLNREAVKKIGIDRLDKFNFNSAPRFQLGGFVDSLVELPGKFTRPIADAGTKALDLLSKGPAAFINMLPKPNIPQPLKGVGPYVLERAIDFIKRAATSPLKDNDWVDSNTASVARFLASKFGASISSSYRSPAQNAAVGGVPNSSHTRGTPSNPGAFDFVPPSGAMQSFAGKSIAGIAENMIHDVGSGLHNHIAFFQRGGAVRKRGASKAGKKPGYYPGKARIKALNPKIAFLVEDIELLEQAAGADWSEDGSELGPKELKEITARYEKLRAYYEKQRDLIIIAMDWLRNSIARAQKVLRGEKNENRKDRLKRTIRARKSALSGLGASKVELQGVTGRGGLIGDTIFRLKGLGVGVDDAPGPSNADITQLLRQQLEDTQRSLSISRAQMPIFQQFMPKFHQGGIVQGPTGQERPVMAQAGEGIFTREQMRAMGQQNITVVIEDGAVDAGRIRVEVDGVLQDKISSVRRSTPNRRYATK